MSKEPIVEWNEKLRLPVVNLLGDLWWPEHGVWYMNGTEISVREVPMRVLLAWKRWFEKGETGA